MEGMDKTRTTFLRGGKESQIPTQSTLAARKKKARAIR